MTTKEIIYGGLNCKSLNEKIRKNHYIPYRILTSDTKYEVNKRYFNAYWGSTFKVISVTYNDHGILEDCYIRWDDGNYGLICTDLDIAADLKLEYDYSKIYETDIINSGRDFSGAEIIYWFFMNKINCFNTKYNGFWKFVDNYSDYRISDYSRYKIIGSLENDIYKNCKILRVK